MDPDDLSAETVAAKIGLSAELVFKTLAVHGDRNGVCLGVISENQELNVKALASAPVPIIIGRSIRDIRDYTGLRVSTLTASSC